MKLPIYKPLHNWKINCNPRIFHTDEWSGTVACILPQRINHEWYNQTPEVKDNLGYIKEFETHISRNWQLLFQRRLAGRGKTKNFKATESNLPGIYSQKLQNQNAELINIVEGKHFVTWATKLVEPKSQLDSRVTRGGICQPETTDEMKANSCHTTYLSDLPLFTNLSFVEVIQATCKYEDQW